MTQSQLTSGTASNVSSSSGITSRLAAATSSISTTPTTPRVLSAEEIKKVKDNAKNTLTLEAAIKLENETYKLLSDSSQSFFLFWDPTSVFIKFGIRTYLSYRSTSPQRIVEPNGFVFHFSVDNDPIVFKIIIDILIDYEITGKIIKPGKKFNLDEQEGAEVTLYYCLCPERPWDEIILTLTERLRTAKIKPKKQSAVTQAINDYASYRNNCNLGSPSSNRAQHYLPPKAAIATAEAKGTKSYNPFNADDPIEKIIESLKKKMQKDSQESTSSATLSNI